MLSHFEKIAVIYDEVTVWSAAGECRLESPLTTVLFSWVYFRNLSAPAVAVEA